jgi:hypothetical protein
MADHGRSGDDHIRDREGSRYGREMGDDRSGRGRGGSDRDRSGGMFGSQRGRSEDEWTSGRREELGWGGAGRDRSHGGGEEHRPHRAAGTQSWDRGDRSHTPRGERDAHGEHGEHGARGRGHEGGRSQHDDQRRDHGDQFGYDDRHEGLPIDETSRLIASNKVEGTAVYARDGRRLGSIYNFMVDKRSGKVEYAVMTYGGFLGMGTRYYPMPWDILEYDTRLTGYRVDMLERDLERAPSFDRDSEPSFDTSYGRRVRGWYGLGY